MYVWRIPGEIIETNVLKVWLNNYYGYTVINMREYDITKKFKMNIREKYICDYSVSDINRELIK